jgi:tyrosinase
MVMMKSIMLLVGALLVGMVASVPAAIPSFTAAEIDSGKAIQALGKIAFDTAMARAANRTTGCTKDKVRIRREWWVISQSHKCPDRGD